MYHYPCTLDRVVDGDTVDVTIDLGFSVYLRKRIRLAWLDAPETRTKDLEEKAAGQRAAAWLQRKLESGPLSVKTMIEGKYGRTLGVLYVGNVDINALMINEGYAWPFDAKHDLSTLVG